MALYKTTAIVLRRIPIGETDKIVTLYTREFGKLNAIAKGARKGTSRLSGATEPLMLVRALLAEGMNLDVVTQCEIRSAFQILRGSLGLLLRATYVCELLDKLTEERDPAPEQFDLLLSTLYILQRAVDPDAAVHAFELQLLAQVGYGPRLDACARCDSNLDETALRFSASRGGLLCHACSGATPDAMPIRAETADAMNRLTDEDDARALAALALPIEVRAELNRLLREHLRYRLERDIRSTRLLDAFRFEALANAATPTVDAGTALRREGEPDDAPSDAA